MPKKDLIELTSGFLYTYLIMFTPQMFLESLWSCAPPPIVVSFLQWGVNFIKYVQRNPEVSSIKSFVGIQLHPNWLNACNLRLPAIQACLTMWCTGLQQYNGKLFFKLQTYVSFIWSYIFQWGHWGPYFGLRSGWYLEKVDLVKILKSPKM